MSRLVPVKRTVAFPWAGFGELEQQFERLLGELPAHRPSAGSWVPAVDIHETDSAYILEADLPGMTREDISVSILDDRVTLKGTRKREAKHEEKGYRRYERAEGAFERSFRIDGGVDEAHVEARFENGVLTITLPKPEEAKPRQIAIQTE
jgi:HSP20 family protein